MDILEFYRQHREALDVISDEKAVFLLAFINDLGCTSLDQLVTHFGWSHREIATTLQRLSAAGFSSTDSEETKISVSSTGRDVLRLFGLFETALPKKPVIAYKTNLPESNLRSGKLLDRIGWKLLHELQINGRLSYADLGRRVGLTTPAVVERVKRMEEAGIIVGYRADIDPVKVGMPITAFIRLSAVGDMFTRITNVVKNSPEIVECHRGTGADSFIMKVHVRSMEHLESLIDRLTGFGTASTSIVLSSPVETREIEGPQELVEAVAQLRKRE